MSKTCKCPVCKGSGVLELPYKREIDTLEVKKKIAKGLRKKGYSIRQIMRALGYKSPISIQVILNK